MKFHPIFLSFLLILTQQNQFKLNFLKELLTTSNGQFPFQTQKKSINCDSCLIAIEKLQNMDSKGLKVLFKNIHKKLCPMIEDKEVCEGINDSYIDDVTTHFIRHFLNSKEVCTNIGACSFQRKEATLEHFIQDVMSTKLSKDERHEWIQKSSDRIKNTKNYKVIQLSDLHVDFEYEEGYDAVCNQPFCCRGENGKPKDPKNGAQYWGTFAQCDLPWRTMQNMIEFIANEVDPDVIIWTGDNISHDVWHQTQSNQTLPTRKITEEILKHLKKPMYPIFGNHEAFPADQQDMEGQESQWLKDDVADIWKDVLNQESLHSLKQKGFYSQYNEELNMRFIALNTQACDTINFWLLEKSNDPASELQWLRNELQIAENNHEFAFIFGHIPPGDLYCQTQWSSRYNVLMERYQHIVKAQIYGHTHQDHFEILQSLIDDSLISTIFIAPSATTYSYQNPSFRVFEMMKDNTMKNYEQYRLDLQKANDEGPQAKLEWKVAYNFLEEYNLINLEASSINNLIRTFESDTNKLKKFIRNFYSGSEKLSNENIANLDSYLYHTSTKKYFTCGMKSSNFDQYYNCVGMVHKLKDYQFFMFKFLEKLHGKWKEFE